MMHLSLSELKVPHMLVKAAETKGFNCDGSQQQRAKGLVSLLGSADLMPDSG